MALKRMSLSEIAKAVGGVLRQADSLEAEIEIEGVFTDSRFPVKGGLFVALVGENFDGHGFAVDVEKADAGAILCSKAVKSSLPCVLVPDTGRALLDLSSYYRSLFPIPIIALTGSVGKTTTKEMVACVVGAGYKTLKTEGNFNNEIGMPKTLFELNEGHEAAVIEMGMNHFGEISRLSKAAKPDVALITNIGVSHIENLGSRENILRAKLEILDGLKEGSNIILNADDELLSGADVKGFSPIYFGINSSLADVSASHILTENGHTSFLADIFGQRQKIRIPTIGMHNVYNALAACAVGYLLEIQTEKIAAALEKYMPAGMRQRIRQVAGLQVIEDCYNASPDSVKAAINVLSSMDGDRKIAVLGDMLELGEYSKTAHRLSGEYAAKAGVDWLFTYGERSKETAKAAMYGGVGKVNSLTDKDILAELLARTAQKGDVLLFKASRGMQLEHVIQKFYELIEAK